MRVVWARLLVASLLATLTLGPTVAQAEPWRIGRISPNSGESDAANLNAFRDGMREMGLQEGRDYLIEAKFADGRFERLPAIAAELVKAKVDLLLVGSTSGVRAAKNATSTIPIVMVTTGDPVESGLVESLARPGGNVTGFTALAPDLNDKRLQLLKEAVPSASQLAVLVNANSPDRSFAIQRQGAIRTLDLSIEIFEASDINAIDDAFTKMARSRPLALMVVNDILFISQRRQIVDLAARQRLPAIYGEREFVEAGGFMFYGASLVDLYRRAAGYAHRILKGAKPRDLPVEQPTRFDSVVNLKTARGMVIVVPRSLLARAEVIE